MKILIVSQYFWPESFRITDLVAELVKRGQEVEVLTGKPNYPQGKFYKGYGFFSHSKDIYEGVKIHRVPLIPRGKGSGLRLSLNYLSFVFFSCIYVLFHRKKYDVTLTFAISPITQAYAALLNKKLYKSKSYLWVQDLWPESVMAAGKMKSGFVMRMLNRMVKNIYKKTDEILVQSTAFIPSIQKKGVDIKKIHYMPNWAEDLFTENVSVDKSKYNNIIPDGFIVMFAGNIGEAQDFDSIIKAAQLTKDIPEIKWVIIGDGRKKNWVEKEKEKLGLQNTVKILGRFPVEDMPDFFAHADIMLMTLKDEEIFSLTIPSKIQCYMAFGKPVLGMLNGIGNKLIQEANCGYSVSAGEYIQLAEYTVKAYKESKEELSDKGKNGQKYYNQNFSKKVIIDNLITLFQND